MMDKAIFAILDVGLARLDRAIQTVQDAPGHAEAYAAVAGVALALQHHIELSPRFIPAETALQLKALGHAARRLGRELEYWSGANPPVAWDDCRAAAADLRASLEAARPGVRPAGHPGELGFTAQAAAGGISWRHCGEEARQGFRREEINFESRLVEVLECAECGVRFERLPERRRASLVTL